MKRIRRPSSPNSRPSPRHDDASSSKHVAEAIAQAPLPAALAPPLDESSTPSVSEAAERHRRMVAEAAYFRALNRGFSGGDPQEDWYVAEHEILHAAGKPSG